MSRKKTLQNLKQDKVVQATKYEAARNSGDELGMRRAREAIEKINKEIVRLFRERK